LASGSDRRIEILRMAARIFLEYGYEATSMNLVAEKCGLTKPGLYYHFASKQDLLFSIMSQAMDVLERETREATVSATDSEDRLERIVYAHAHMLAREDDGSFTVLVIDETQGLRPEDLRIITHRKRAYFEIIRATLAQLEKEGRLRPVSPTTAAFSLLGMVMWISKWFDPDGELGADEVARQVTSLALAAVLEDRGTARRPGPVPVAATPL
jgi:TetR/AcrR family transcriptional regulator, cholesterol catabolism regulator